MKHLYKSVLILLVCFSCINIIWPKVFNMLPRMERNIIPEKRIVVVIASYNNKTWYTWNLDSVFDQRYNNYHIIYVDDCSTDGTFELVKAYIKRQGLTDRVTLIHNTQRCGALANQYKAIHMCEDDDIIVILDGDDVLAHTGVLCYINKMYQNPDVWLTYGQFREWPRGFKGFCRPYKQEVIDGNKFREVNEGPSHLRTFYAGLFKKINKEDLMYNGDFFKMSGDIAAMFPMIEMARDHFQCIPDVLLVYNGANALNDHKISKGLQRQLDLVIRSRKRYEKITSLFSEYISETDLIYE